MFNPSSIHLYRPPLNSHKGQNGKLLVIGGSKLFHSSIFWSADVASRVVDIVHFTSPANENNEIIRKKIKANFWTGIVADWGDVEEYIQEDDAVLIGPGMERTKETESIVNHLLTKYPHKKWVVDGGALQMVDPKLITESCILTPHKKEMEGVIARLVASRGNLAADSHGPSGLGMTTGRYLNHCTVLLKGSVDTITQGSKSIEISGGPPSLAIRLWELFVHGSRRTLRRASNPGLTKGGTGDVLAGLVAALYCKNNAFTAASAASYINKKAGETLYQKVGYYFNAQDLITAIPEILKEFKGIYYVPAKISNH